MKPWFILEPVTYRLIECNYCEEQPEGLCTDNPLVEDLKDPYYDGGIGPWKNYATEAEQLEYDQHRAAMATAGEGSAINEIAEAKLSNEVLNSLYPNVKLNYRVYATKVEGGTVYEKISESKWFPDH